MEKDLMKIISVVGPTASGKTDLAIKIAEIFNGEIISADSMQIYKEFNILSAKPSVFQLESVPHHLVNFVSVSESFSVSDFVVSAKFAAEDITKRGRIPVLVGGTGLYADSFLKGMSFENEPPKNDEKRAELEKMSNEELMEILIDIDEVSAEKIHINNTKRLIRAIEFFYSAGYPISEQVRKSKGIVSPYDVCKIGINFRSRDLLYDRINLRVDKMFESGILDEVRKISNLEVSKTAAAAIGYKELLPYVNLNQLPENAKEILKKASRNYAKRQLVWLRRDKEIHWIYGEDFENSEEMVKAAGDIIKNSFKCEAVVSE